MDMKSKDLQALIIHLSTGRNVRRGEVYDKMYSLHNDIYADGGSEFIERWEDVNTRCGSCIRRTHTNLMKHFHKYMYSEDMDIVLKDIHPQGGKPLFRWKTDEEKKAVKAAEASDAVVAPKDADEGKAKWEGILQEGESPRQAYQRVVGKKPFGGWDEDTLLEKILKHETE